VLDDKTTKKRCKMTDTKSERENREKALSLVERKINVLKLRYELNQREIDKHYAIISELRKEQALIESKLGALK
jgi:hypothetical protein